MCAAVNQGFVGYGLFFRDAGITDLIYGVWVAFVVLVQVGEVRAHG